MKADYIKDIIRKYDKSPYECILIDGPWGVGKSYALEEALKDNNNVCYISMFGMQDAQEIYHEVFLQLVAKSKNDISGLLSRAMNIGAVFSDKMATIKGIVESLIKEKELFLDIAKSFNNYHFIVIDDLERMKATIKMEEVFGVIDELKRCNYVKVILVANTKEIIDKHEDCFKKYNEKVIDRSYCITERSEKVDWSRLRIHCGFITEFLEKHNVKNLRTLQKAQNFYEDVKLKMEEGDYNSDFYDEIRLACYALVVETSDNLYYRETDNSQTDSLDKIIQSSTNRLETRINNHYLSGTRISRNLVVLLNKYYNNEKDIVSDEIEAEYQMFIHAGEKANYYKSDDELKPILLNLEEKIRQESIVANMIRYADEYFYWCECLKLNVNSVKEEYKKRLHDMLYELVMNGNEEYLTYGIDSFYDNSKINKEIVEDVIETIRKESIVAYIKYLSEKTYGEDAYRYSYILKEYVKNSYFKQIISENIAVLYNEKSFPVYIVDQQQYNTIYNIMYVLCHENSKKFLIYCDELKSRCDNMATHRLSKMVEGLIKEGC